VAQVVEFPEEVTARKVARDAYLSELMQLGRPLAGKVGVDDLLLGARDRALTEATALAGFYGITEAGNVPDLDALPDHVMARVSLAMAHVVAIDHHLGGYDAECAVMIAEVANG
jgi:hypothetical protein